MDDTKQTDEIAARRLVCSSSWYAPTPNPLVQKKITGDSFPKSNPFWIRSNNGRKRDPFSFGSGSTRSFFPNEPDNIRGAVENILYLSRIPVRISTYPVLYETEIFGPFRGPSPGSRTQRSDWFSHGTTIRDVQLPPTPVIGPRWVHVSQRIENIRMPRRKSTLLGISQQTLLDQRGENSMICRRHKRIERPPRYTPNRSKFRFGGVIDDIG